jgi:phage/plasmid-like protein (TIGR03299 family)
MTHEVMVEADGRVNMAYVGDLPWHALGNELDENATRETWQIKGGVDFEWERRELFFQAKDEAYIKYPRRVAIVHSRTGKPLSVVSTDYKLVQPCETLDFCWELCEKLDFKMETVGVLRDGRTVWACATVPGDFTLPGNDKVRPYCMFSTTCDYEQKTVAQFQAIRPVCNNTVSAAIDAEGRNTGSQVRISHAREYEREQVMAQMGLLPEAWARFQALAEEMAARKVTKDEAVEFFTHLLFRDHDKIDPAKIVKPVARLLNVYESGVGQQVESANETVWGLLNAVTRMEDHERNYRNASTRMSNVMFGDGARMKQRAWNSAVELLAA